MIDMYEAKVKKVGLLADLNLCVIFDNGEERYFRLKETRDWPQCTIIVEEDRITIGETEFAADFLYTKSNPYDNPFNPKHPRIFAAFDIEGRIEDTQDFFE